MRNKFIYLIFCCSAVCFIESVIELFSFSCKNNFGFYVFERRRTKKKNTKSM